MTLCRHNRHIQDALSSLLNQTRPVDEILIVDSSTDSAPADLASSSHNIRYLRHEAVNAAAARNLGIRETTSDCLLFLDPNDLLLPNGVETAIRYFEDHPETDIALFDFKWTDDAAHSVWPSGRNQHVPNDPLLHLLSGDCVFAPSSTFYRRRAFPEVGDFLSSVAAACDRDFLLRAAQSLSVVVEDAIIAKCRPLQESPKNVLNATRKALRQVDLDGRPPQYRNMRRQGIARAEAAYGGFLWRKIRGHVRQRKLGAAMLTDTWKVATAYPHLVAAELGQFVRHRVGNKFYPLATANQKQVRHLRALARLQLKGAQSVSTQFGYDRGQPLDRYYIERFLSDHSPSICGRVLEIKNSHYTKRFGGDRVSQSDVLHPDAAWPEATLHGNLTDPSAFEANQFDCVILTQTLHLIYNMRAVLKTVEKILKPGGILLATAPCISKIYQLNEPPHLKLDQDSWRMTKWSFGKVLSEFFPEEQVHVSAAGNLVVNAAFLYGLAAEDLPSAILHQSDSDNEMILLATAVKQS